MEDGLWMVLNNAFCFLFYVFVLLVQSFMIDHVVFFLAVFNVTDQDGNKITDEGMLDYIQKVGRYLFFASI